MENKRANIVEVKGWRFYPIEIYAPASLHGFINDEIQRQALSSEGFFTHKTVIPKEDEMWLDDLLMAEAFDVKCSLVFYKRELEKYGVIGDGGMFDKQNTYNLFYSLKAAVLCLKADSNQPMTVRNHIAEIVALFDKMPVWGLFFQILMLQGVVSLLERLDIEEGDAGFDEAQDICDWVCGVLEEKVTWFCSIGAIEYGEDDLKRLEPFCDFLMHTEVGKAVQSVLAKVIGETEADNDFILGNTKQEYPILSENLRSIFLNNDTILQTFLAAIKGKDGVDVTDEVDALARMNGIDNNEKGDPLWKELSDMGYYTRTRQNWNRRLKKQGRTKSEIEKIQKKYQAIVNFEKK